MDNFDDREFTSPVVLEEDISQEVELLKLENQKNPLAGAPVPSKRIIRMQMESELLPTFFEIPFDSIQPDQLDTRERNVEASLKLVEWAMTQSDEVQAIILEFLDNPTEHNFVIARNRLSKLGKAKVASGSKEKVGFAELVRRRFRQHNVLTKDKLYELARTSHSSKRPEAAVRQTLRRLIENGSVIEIKPNQYQWKGE